MKSLNRPSRSSNGNSVNNGSTSSNGSVSLSDNDIENKAAGNNGGSSSNDESTDDNVFQPTSGHNSANISQTSVTNNNSGCQQSHRIKPCKMINTSVSSLANSSSTNLASKTSVFERLYKSNIAAHLMNQNSNENNGNASGSLKKTMSTSSTSLVSSTSSSNNLNANASQQQTSQRAESSATAKLMTSTGKKKAFGSSSLSRKTGYCKADKASNAENGRVKSASVNSNSDEANSDDHEEISQSHELANSSSSSFVSHQIN